MDKSSFSDPHDMQRINKLVSFVDELRMNSEIDFGNFSAMLEGWVAKIQTFVTDLKHEGSPEGSSHAKKLLDISSNFVDLLDSIDQVKQHTMSVTEEMLETLSETPAPVEEIRQFDSHKIKLHFVQHDSEIGGLIHGIISVPHHQFLITGHNSGDISVWGKNTLHLVHQFKAHESPITTMAYLEEEKLLMSGALDGQVRIYGCCKFPVFQHVKTMVFDKKKPLEILPLPKLNWILISCKEGYIYILNKKSLKLIKTIKRPGQLDSSIVYISEMKAIVIGLLGNDNVELISIENFKTLEIIDKKFMVQTLKGIQYNPLRKELVISFAYKIIKVYKFINGKAIEDRELYIDKPFPSKIDFIDEEYMVFASFSDKLDFIRTEDGQPVKSINLGFTFSDFLLIKEERRIIVFPYQSSESSIGIVEY